MESTQQFVQLRRSESSCQIRYFEHNVRLSFENGVSKNNCYHPKFISFFLISDFARKQNFPLKKDQTSLFKMIKPDGEKIHVSITEFSHQNFRQIGQWAHFIGQKN